MTTLLAGLDFSSRAIDAALIPLDPADTSTPPVTFRRFELPVFKPGATTSQYRSVERARTVAFVPMLLLGSLHEGGPDVECVWVEEPFGHSQNVMRELYGGILASIPTHVAVSTITPAQWRKHHGISSGKAVSKIYAWNAMATFYPECDNRFPDEHQADALLVALAGRDLEHAGRAA